MSDIEDIINYAESEAEEGEGVIQSDEETNENQPQNAENEQNKEEEDDDKKVVKPKRVVRNPQPKLNAESLKGPRGLKALKSCFANTKYKGKGHEADDLQVILKTYEHWCHRLFPKLPFDDCIKKIETLGHKKPVITCIKKIRFGMEDADEIVDNTKQDDQEADDVSNDTNAILDNNLENPFDKLLQDRQVPPKQPNPQEENISLTDEQLERIRRNRELALERRRLRMQQETNNEQNASNTDVSERTIENTAALQRSTENVTENNENLAQNESTREEHNETLNATVNAVENVTNMQENDLALIEESTIKGPVVIATPIKTTKSIPTSNKIFISPQPKVIILNSSSVEVANESELEEISQDSKQESDTVLEELSQSSTNVFQNVPGSNLPVQNSGVLGTTVSNVELNEMDIDN